MSRVEILGVPVDPLTREQLARQLERYVGEQAHALVLHANVHGVNLAQQLPWLRALYRRAEVVFCDGSGIILGARILGHAIPERITYADWIWQLAEFACARGYSLFLLGAARGVAEQAAAQLRRRNPDLRIAGVYYGYFDKTPGSIESEAVIAMINRARPDILLVSFGMPLQERWLSESWDKIDARVALTAGAALDYASGQLQRGPRLLTGNGFEWLARLIIEPRRLWRRYILGNPIFLWRVLLQRLGRYGEGG